MALYDWKCRGCGRTKLTEDRSAPPFCQICEQAYGRNYRGIGFHRKGSIDPHFNRSLGMPISNDREFREELKKVGAQMSERLGMDTNYQPVDRGDPDRYGVGEKPPDVKIREKQADENRRLTPQRDGSHVDTGGWGEGFTP